MANPGAAHIHAAKRILRYLKGTKHLKLTYRKTQTAEANTLEAFADADHAGDPDTRRSVTGYVIKLNGAAVSWQSARQHVTALSTAEAEYYSASVAGVDITYHRRLMEEMGHAQQAPTITWEDNVACIYMSRTSVMYHKARHIDTRVYRLREMCKEGTMRLEKISTQEQTADIMTKGLPKAPFVKHRNAMLGTNSTDEDTGEVDEDMEAEQRAFDKMYGDVNVYPPEDENDYMQRMQQEQLM
jgi:hypothetical protein